MAVTTRPGPGVRGGTLQCGDVDPVHDHATRQLATRQLVTRQLARLGAADSLAVGLLLGLGHADCEAGGVLLRSS